MKKRLSESGNVNWQLPKIVLKTSPSTWLLNMATWLTPLFLLFFVQSSTAQITYSEGFESGIGGWTTSTGSAWATTTSLVCNGTNSVRKNIYTTGTQANFVSPLVGTSNGGVITMSFQYKVTDWSAGTVATPATFGTINVQYSSSTSGPWTTVHTINSTNHTPSTTCATVSVGSFTPAPGNFYVRFECLYGAGDYWLYFDDVNITQGLPPTCVQPSALTATSITSSGATLGWTENGTATSWEVEYGLLGFTPGTGTTATASTNPLSISMLAPNTTYSYYVRSNCGSNGYSVWSGPYTFTTLCASQVSGTVTIDPSMPPSSTNFTSFAAFASEITVCGIGGPVTVNVKQGTYTEQVNFSAVVGSSVANNITIQANPSNTAPVILTYAPAGSTDNFTINLVGASNISFKNLTINSGGTSFSRIIQIGGTCANIEFDGNTFNGPNVAINTTSQSTFYYGTSPVVDGLIITNNTFNNNSHIFYYVGSSTTTSDSLVFENNTCSGYYAYGIYASYFERSWIRNNVFINSASTTTQYGVYLFGGSTNTNQLAIIEGNTITANTPSTFYGIYMSYYVSSMAAPSTMINNMVANTATTGTGTVYGIYPFACSYLNIFHNTVAINAGSATASRAAYFNTTGTTYNNVDVRNNIFSHAGPSGYAIEVSNLAHTNNYLSNLNYNVYNYQPTNAAPYRYNNVNSANLAAWQLSSSKDANSFEGDPVFVSTADLHVLGPIANNVGDNTVGVTTDIDGQTRPGGGSSTVDIGADEFNAISADIGLISGLLDRDLCYSVNDTVKLTIKNVIGSTIDFSTTPLTAVWSVAGPTNSNGTILVNAGTLAAGATMVIKGGGVQMPSGGTYNLMAYINPNAANASALNDTLGSVSLNVNKLLAAAPTITSITNSTDTVELQAFSSFFPSAGFFITEVSHFKTAVGQPVGGWPSYLQSDDYIEITGAPFSDLGGITLEQWTTTSLSNSYTFPSGTILGPNGTAIICVGQPSGSPSPSDYYYFANTSITWGSTTGCGRILKDGLGNIVDAVGYSGSTTAYTFPAAANVSATDWSSSILGGGSSSGIRLEGADVNSGTNWVLSATSPQNPNSVNANVIVPAAPPVPNFSWVLDGSTVSSNTSFWAGPFTMNGTYKYIATYNSASCGMIYDTATIEVNLPCGYTVEMIDTYGDGWNGAVVSFEVNGVVVDSVGYNFTGGSSATANVGFFDMDTVVIKLKSAGQYPNEIGFTVKNPQGIALYSHAPSFGLSSGYVFTNMYSQCYISNCPITDVPSVTAQTSCGPNPVTFTATGSTKANQGYFWMRSSDSAIVALGNTYTTPPITANQTWYAGIGSIDETAASASAGIPVTGTTGGYGNFTNGMYFTALDFFYLDSMTVRASGPLSFIIRISEPTAAGAGAQIMISDTFTIAAAGDHQIAVDMAFSPGNYFMNMSVIPGSGTGALWRTTAMPTGVTFPVTTPGIVSITGPNFATPRWYYFFDWVVSEVCVSSFAAANANFAPIPSTSIPYAENFNTGLPCNWSIDGNGAEWMHTTSYNSASLNGSAFMMLDDDAAGSSVLTNASLNTPTFGAIGYDTLWIEFDHYFRAIGSSQGHVEVWDGTAWVSVYSTGTSNVGGWSNPNHQAINITAYQNVDLKIRFRYDDAGAWGWYWSVDNFELDGVLSPCQNVVVNVVTDIYGSECSWSIVDTATGIAYATGGPYNDVSPYNAALATHIDTICIPSNHWYEFRLEDSYGDGLFDGTNTGTFNAYIICPWGNNTILTGSGASAYGSSTNPPSWDSTVFEVTCLLNCPIPSALGAAVTCSGADLTWTSDSAAATTVEYGPAGFTPGTGTIVNGASSPLSVSGLNANTNYSFYVMDSCWSGSVSAWAGPFNFTTDSIAKATNLGATPACTTASITWASATNSNGSTVQWGPTGFTPGSGTFINNASSPTTLSGLTNGTTYDFWVLDSCGNNASAWAGPYTFTTDDVPTVTGSFSIGTIGATQATVNFNSSVTGGTATSYTWDFGDANSGTGAAPTHDYTANGTYTVIVAATNACGTGYDTLTVVIQGIGLDEFGFGNIGLYPNPNDGFFVLTGLTDFGNDATIEVINLAGAVVYSTSVIANATEEVKIDLRGLPAGMYHVRVRSEHGAGTKPFIIR